MGIYWKKWNISAHSLHLFFFSFPFLGFVFVSLLEHGAVMQVKWRRSQLPFDVNFWIFPLRRASWRCTAGGRAGGACKRRSGSPDTTRTHPGTGIHTAPSHTDALGGTQILSIEQEQMDIFKLEAQVFQIFIYSVVFFLKLFLLKRAELGRCTQYFVSSEDPAHLAHLLFS